jgi:hypothetical protein
MRRRFCKKRRTAAAMVETALTLPVFFLLVIGGLDLGLHVHARNQTAWVACQLARIAATHGYESERGLAAWGPDTVDWSRAIQETPGDAALAQEMFETFETMTQVLPHRDVHVRLEWPDGSHHTGDRVRATVHATHEPLLGWRVAGGSMKAFSTTLIQR